MTTEELCEDARRAAQEQGALFDCRIGNHEDRLCKYKIVIPPREGPEPPFGPCPLNTVSLKQAHEATMKVLENDKEYQKALDEFLRDCRPLTFLQPPPPEQQLLLPL